MRTDSSNLLRAAGRMPRARRAPKVPERELALHTAVVDLLRTVGRREWQWAHYPSGEAREARTGAKLKRMGAKRGWPDLILISPQGAFHGLELKAESGTLTNDQRDFQSWAIRHGIRYGVARSIDEVLVILDAWGAIAKIGAAG